MVEVFGLYSYRHWLGKDIGLYAAGDGTYDVWLSQFRTTTIKTFADLSFKTFFSLPMVNAYGAFATEMNGALRAAKLAVHQPVSHGVIVNGQEKLGGANDYWLGGAGNDNLNAGGGNDVVVSGAGNDVIFGGNGNDLIFGGTGTDSIIGAAGNDTIFGGADRDIIRGWAGDDFIFGGSGNDGLYGATGNDTIFGGDGNDYICAGSDHDVVYGGAGRDTFAFRGTPENSVSLIKDFEVLYDRQGIKSELVDGHLSIDMIKAYDDGLMIDFGLGRAICYEGVWDATALFQSMFLLES